MVIGMRFDCRVTDVVVVALGWSRWRWLSVARRGQVWPMDWHESQAREEEYAQERRTIRWLCATLKCLSRNEKQSKVGPEMRR